MQRWKVPALLGFAVVAVVLVLGPWIRSPFRSPVPATPPLVQPPVTLPALPPAITSGPITMEILPSQSLLQAGEPTELFVAVKLTAKDMGSVARPPLNLSLVLDKSGSMTSEKKIDYLRKAAKQLIEQLAPSDILSIVVFDSEVELLAPAGPVQDKVKLCKLIDEITPSGSTNISGGFQRGCEEIAKHVQSGWIDRVLLLTDGLANNGETDPGRLNRMASDAHEKGITLSTFGMGAEFNEDLLQGMAESGAGQYHFIESAEQVTQMYASELKDLMQTAARRAVLKLSPAEGVEIREVCGHNAAREGKAALVSLGDLYGGQTRKVVCRLGLTSGVTGPRPIGSFELAYRDVQSSSPVQVARPLALGTVESAAAVAASRDLKVLELVESAQAGVTLDSAMRLFQSGKRDEAKRVLQSQIRRTSDRNQRELRSRALDTQVRQYEGLLKRYDAPMSEVESSLMIKSGKVMGAQAAR